MMEDVLNRGMGKIPKWNVSRDPAPILETMAWKPAR